MTDPTVVLQARSDVDETTKTYKILSHRSTETLEEMVEAALEQGWNLQGGIAIEGDGGSSYRRFYQAIYRSKEGYARC